MIRFPQSEIQKEQRGLIDGCKHDVFSKLDSCINIVETLAPTAVMKDDQGKIKVLVSDVLKTKLPEFKEWIKEVLEAAYRLNPKSKIKSSWPNPIKLPSELSLTIIRAITAILSCSKDLEENDYYFISHVGKATNLEIKSCLTIIEQAQKRARTFFIDFLLDILTEKECFQCAVLFYQAIQADSLIHLAELKYMSDIHQLIDNDPVKLEVLEKESSSGSPLPDIKLNRELATQVFVILVEIVLCDQDFDPKESGFLNKIGHQFKLSPSHQEKIIQAVASLVLLKSVLFSQTEEI